MIITGTTFISHSILLLTCIKDGWWGVFPGDWVKLEYFFSFLHGNCLAKLFQFIYGFLDQNFFFVEGGGSLKIEID